jgi:hypothetical protein
LWQASHAWRLLGRTVVGRAQAVERLRRGGGLPIDLRVHDPEAGPEWSEAWVVTDALVGRLATRCREADVAFATLIFPSQIEATAAGRAAAEAAWPVLAGWDLTLAMDRATGLAGRHGPALDLTPALSGAQDQGPLYYPEDGHWTSRGHMVAAQAAAPFLAELLYPVPSSEGGR